MTPTAEMKDVAERLLAWSNQRFGRLFSDVVIWWRNPEKGHVSLAFQGDALSIERNLLVPEMLRNPTFSRGGIGYLDESLQKALGVEVGQTMDTPDVGYYFMLDGVETAVSAKLELEEKFQYPSVFATLLPKEGSPWNTGSAATEWYSAKKRKVFRTTKPSWVIEGTVRDPETGRDKKDLVADVCSLVDPVSARACGTAVVGDLRGMQFFATHSFSLGGRGPEEETAAAIAKCGGLLFPSIAVGHLPANNFGPLTLFADVRLALLSTKPYKQSSRGRIEVPLYGTDVWTETTSHFLSSFARDLFLQLTGNPSDESSLTQAPRYMAVLGPRIGGSGGPVSEEADRGIVVSTTRLAKLLQKRMKLWTEKADPKTTTERYWDQPERYPYLEAKVAAKVPMDCFPLAAAPEKPERLAKAALAFLRTAGYAGPLLLVNTDGLSQDFLEGTSFDPDLYEYAWRMRRAVLEFVAGKEYEGASQYSVRILE